MGERSKLVRGCYIWGIDEIKSGETLAEAKRGLRQAVKDAKASDVGFQLVRSVDSISAAELIQLDTAALVIGVFSDGSKLSICRTEDDHI